MMYLIYSYIRISQRAGEAGWSPAHLGHSIFLQPINLSPCALKIFVENRTEQ